MQGLMQDWPLLQSKLLEHAETFHPRREIVTYSTEGPVHRSSYAELARRAKQCAQAMARLGVERGDRVATLAWNTARHVEIWFGVSGMGAVAHTVNPRLADDHIAYILNHAEDKILCLDLSFAPIVERLRERLESLAHIVLLTDRANMPGEGALSDALCYEELLAAEDGDFAWPDLDETTASGLCYTSGTTGDPKGVLYSHRSTVLHTMATAAADTLGVRSPDTVAPIVPMFHANGWGIPFLAAMTGAKLVLNGPHHDPETLWRIFDEEAVTVTAAVPTIWLGLLDYLRKTGKALAHLDKVTIGGSAAPRAMIQAFQEDYGVQVNHAWGMTELNPLGSVGTHTAETAALPAEEKFDLQAKQGRPIFGVELRVLDSQGRVLAHDGKTSGHLQARGAWAAKAYFRREEPLTYPDGFFDTGDVASIDPNGFIHITDRSKDVIKSGGEWISSIALENAAMGHPEVQEAAVIGVAHPKWGERPLLVVVAEEGKEVSRESLLTHLGNQVAKWWLPDDIVFVEEIPHTATGKIQKTALREQFKDYTLPSVEA